MNIKVYIGDDVEHAPLTPPTPTPSFLVFPEAYRSPRQLRDLLAKVCTGDGDIGIVTLSPLVLSILEDMRRTNKVMKIETFWCSTTGIVPAQSTMSDPLVWSLYGDSALYECDLFGVVS